VTQLRREVVTSDDEMPVADATRVVLMLAVILTVLSAGIAAMSAGVWLCSTWT